MTPPVSPRQKLDGLIRQLQQLEGQVHGSNVAAVYAIRVEAQHLAADMRREARGAAPAPLADARALIARDLAAPLRGHLRGGGALGGLRGQLEFWSEAVQKLQRLLKSADLDARSARADGVSADAA